jgi:hypothetical protein
MARPQLWLLATSSALLSGIKTTAYTSGWKPGWVQRTSVARSATIFSPAGNDDEPGKIIREEYESSLYGSLFSETPKLNKDLADFISRDSMGALARLAVVFSPADRRLELRDIEHARVLSIDENTIQIEAVLCEYDGCVTIAVPVSFPNPCVAERGDLTGCVLENINALDEEANCELRKINWEKDHHEEIEASKRQLKALQNLENIDLPCWWVNPGPELVEECSFLRNLLNEDEFFDEVAALALHSLRSSMQGGFEVDQASVAAVGPAGLVIRVSYKEGTTTHMVEATVSFRQVTNDSSSIRAAVLGAISLPSTANGDVAICEKTTASDTQAEDQGIDGSIELPSWWLEPDAQLMEECSSLIDFLNGEASSKEVTALASNAMKKLLQEEDFEVDKATVGALGPAGLVILASYKEVGLLGDDSTEVETIELPLPFEEVAHDVPSLRAAVLRTIPVESKTGDGLEQRHEGKQAVGR